MTSASLNITINADDLLEGNENFTLTINSSGYVTCIDPCQTTVTIVDNAGNCISISKYTVVRKIS